jgi:hypothetical protein
VWVATGAEAAQGEAPIGGFLYEIALLAQEGEEAEADIAIVVYDEDAAPGGGKG